MLKSNFMKIRPVGAELSHANGGSNGQTDTAKLIFAFRLSVKARKKSNTCPPNTAVYVRACRAATCTHLNR